VLNIDTGFNLFQYASEITGAKWPSTVDGKIEVVEPTGPTIEVLDVVKDTAAQTNATAVSN